MGSQTTEGKQTPAQAGAARPAQKANPLAREPGREVQTPELLDSLPPNNLEIERELIGCLFLEGTASAFELLEPADFYDEMHAFLFTELKAAWKVGVPFNTEGALVAWMKRRGMYARLQKLFGQVWLHDLVTGATRGLPAHVHYYCSVLRDLRKRRDAIHLCLKATQGAYNDKVSWSRWRKRVGELLEQADKTPEIIAIETK